MKKSLDTPTTSTESAATDTDHEIEIKNNLSLKLNKEILTDSTKISSVVTNISNDNAVHNHVIDVKEITEDDKKDTREQNKVKSHFNEESDPLDEKDEMFPSYESHLHFFRRKFTETSSIVKKIVNDFVTYYYNIVRPKLDADDSTFKKFLDRRNEEKQALYFKVFMSGALICIAGITVNTISVSHSEHTWMFAVESIAGSFFRVFGGCIMSVVPTKEFDLIEKMCRIYYLRLLAICLATIFIILWAISNSDYMKNDDYFKFLLSIQAIIIILFSSFLKKVVSYQWTLFTFHTSFMIAWLGNGILALDTFYQFKYVDAALSAGVYFFISFLMLLVTFSARKKFDLSITSCFFPVVDANYLPGIRKEIDDDGWGGRIIFIDVYISFIFLMFALMIRAAGYLNNDEPTIALYWFLSGSVDTLPMIPVALFGEKKCFSLVARYYEYNIETLQKDGACLSQLVSKSISKSTSDAVTGSPDGQQSGSTKDVDRTIWIYRENKSEMYQVLNHELKSKDKAAKDKTPINKVFWMRGSPHELKSDLQTEKTEGKVVKYEGVKVSFAHDVGIYYYFEGKEYKSNEDIYSHKEGTINAFEKWKSCNFKAGDIVESNPEEKYVVIRQEKKEVATSNLEELKSWAEENMRKLELGKYSKRLLKRLLRQSPREIGSAFTCEHCTLREKERLYNLTTKVPKIKFEWEKIDYFVSHSWEDSSEDKWRALKKFAKIFFLRNKRYPTLWLDKVCIDQRNSARALEVLPISIASSKKMLVIMSDTYLQRLWCIWELFTLFSFCSKELAIERLEIIFLNPKSANKSEENMILEMIEKIEALAVHRMDNGKISPIESSHCFGPDEEFKLRNILFDIGFENLSAAFMQIASALREKMKKSLYDELSEKLNSIMSSITNILKVNNVSVHPAGAKND